MVTITVPARTGGSINVDLPSRDGGGSIDINLAARGERPTTEVLTLTTEVMADVTAINAYLSEHAGSTIYVTKGPHRPNYLETGTSIIVPANTTLVALGQVRIYTDNPTRPAILMTGTGGALKGSWYVIGDYIPDGDYQWRDGEDQDNWPVNAKISRMNQSWAAGDADYAAWAIAHHAAHPEYPLMAYNASNWSAAWNASFPHTRWEQSGALKSPNRCAAVASYDADNIVIEDLRISNFISGVMLAGRDGIIASDAVAPDYQTRNIKIGRVRGDLFEFLVLATRQANNTIEEATVEWNGLRIQDKQPHVLYLSNEPADHEWSDATHVGVVRAKGYNGGSVVKAKAQRGFTWGEIYASGSQSAINILEYCTGVGGNVILEDQCESPSPGTNFAVRINFSPGFVIAGKIKVDHRANVDDLRCLSVENSDDVKIVQGVDLSVARATAGQPMCRIRNSKRVSVGTFNYQDANSRDSLLWTLSDSQDDGGNASDNTFEFGDVRGTNRLIEFLGLSANNEIRLDPRRIEDWDAEDALVNSGLGTGNYFVDVSSGNRRVLEITQSTSLSAPASNTLTVPRIDPTEADEEQDLLPTPKLFVNNDTITINGRVYTWKTTLTGAVDEILIPNTGLATTYTQMAGKSLGYLQLAFIDAAINLTSAYGAGIGVIYGSGTLINADVEAEWGGNELNVVAKTGGTGPNAYVCSVSSTATGATWATATLTGGGDFTNSYFNRTLVVTTGASNLVMTLPTSAPEGTWVDVVKDDAATGTVDCGGYALLALRGQRAQIAYEGGEWRATYSAPATIYFSAAGSGTGLSSSSPTTFALAFAAYEQYQSRVKQAYRMEEVGSGTYTFTTSPISLGNVHAGSPLTISFGASSIVQGTNTAETRTAQFARVQMGAELIIFQNECLLRTWGAAVRASYGGRVTLHDSKIKDCVRAASMGYGGRFICESIVDWDGRDLADTAITDSNALLAVIGSTYSCDQGSFGPVARVHHWNRGFVLSEGSSGHMDYLWFDSCDIGYEMGRGAGQPNAIPVRCTNCVVGIKSDGNPLLLSTTEATWIEQFGIGTADECDTTIRLVAGGTTSGIEDGAYDSRPTFSGNQITTSGSSTTGNTTENDTWAPLVVLPKGARAKDWIKTKQHFTFTLTTADCVFRVYADGLLGYVTIPIGTVWADIYVDIDWQDNSTDVGGSIRAECSSANTDGLITTIATRITLATGTNAFPITGSPASTQVQTTMQLGNAGDSYRQIFGEVTHTIAGARYAL